MTLSAFYPARLLTSVESKVDSGMQLHTMCIDNFGISRGNPTACRPGRRLAYIDNVVYTAL